MLSKMNEYKHLPVNEFDAELAELLKANKPARPSRSKNKTAQISRPKQKPATKKND